MRDARYGSAEEAEAAFYRAFQRRDLDAMMAVWADEPGVVCVHPGGPLLIGPQAVRAGWQEILRGSQPMTFVIEEASRHADGALAVHVLREHIRLPEDARAGSVVATNVYRLTEHGWRMVLHHASPATRPSGRSGTVH